MAGWKSPNIIIIIIIFIFFFFRLRYDFLLTQLPKSCDLLMESGAVVLCCFYSLCVSIELTDEALVVWHWIKNGKKTGPWSWSEWIHFTVWGDGARRDWCTVGSSEGLGNQSIQQKPCSGTLTDQQRRTISCSVTVSLHCTTLVYNDWNKTILHPNVSHLIKEGLIQTLDVLLKHAFSADPVCVCVCVCVCVWTSCVSLQVSGCIHPTILCRRVSHTRPSVQLSMHLPSGGGGSGCWPPGRRSLRRSAERRTERRWC